MTSTIQLDPERLAVIRECMENYDVGDADAEWPNNIISRFAVVYNDGTIARKGDDARHAVDEAELALCRGLAEDAAKLMAGVSVGMGSQSSKGFSGFFIAATPGSVTPAALDEALIRSRFGGTLFPPVTMTIEPFAEDTTWWDEVATDGEDSDPSYFTPWHAMSSWFRQRSEFTATAFVRIGDNDELFDLPKTAYPPGTEITGCVLPRLALGLTRRGSLAGLFGYVVQS